MSRVIFLISVLLCGNILFADHWAGGHIAYKHIGSLPTSHLYEVTLYLFRDTNGIPVGNSAKIYYRSSCFGIDSVEFNLDSKVLLVSDYSCVDDKTGGVYKAYSYTGTIQLPGICNDWSFGFKGCCRSMYLSNIANPQNTGIYLESTLNNTLGPNSSAEFESLSTKTFCFNPQFPVDWEHPAVDPDKDSIYYRLSAPMQDEITPLPFENGYSATQPFKSNPPLAFDNFTSQMTLRPIDIELDILRVEALEFRKDANTGNWVMVGSSSKEIQVPIVAYCSDEVVFWELSGRADTMVKHYPYYCGDSSLTFYTSQHFLFNSVAPDASDFLITDGNKQLSILTVDALNDSTIKLQIGDTISRQDNYHLIIQYGSDNTTLINDCGYRMIPNDSLHIVHMGCSGVSLKEFSNNYSQIYPNPIKDVIHIDLMKKQDLKISLMNMNGSLLKEIQLKGSMKYSVSTSEVPAGLYFLHILSEGSHYTKKIIKL